MVANRRFSGRYRELVLDAPELANSVRAGQFVNILCSTADDPLLRRPFSVYRVDPGAGTIGILYEVLGRGTSLIARWERGDVANVLGPLGNYFTVPEGEGPLALVGGGVGVAPLLALAHEVAPSGRPIHALLGARTASMLLGVDEFEALGVRVSLSTDDGSQGYHGLVSGLLASLLQGGSGREPLRPDALFTCGPRPMMAAIAEIARAHGIPCSVSMEVSMACGFGVCMGCAWPVRSGSNSDASGPTYRLVCTDGPVFNADEIIWEPRQARCACAGGKAEGTGEEHDHA